MKLKRKRFDTFFSTEFIASICSADFELKIRTRSSIRAFETRVFDRKASASHGCNLITKGRYYYVAKINSKYLRIGCRNLSVRYIIRIILLNR